MSGRDVVTWVAKRLTAIVLSVVLYAATTGVYIAGYALSLSAFTLKLGPELSYHTLTYLLVTGLLNATVASIGIVVILKDEVP